MWTERGERSGEWWPGRRELRSPGDNPQAWSVSRCDGVRTAVATAGRTGCLWPGEPVSAPMQPKMTNRRAPRVGKSVPRLPRLLVHRTHRVTSLLRGRLDLERVHRRVARRLRGFRFAHHDGAVGGQDRRRAGGRGCDRDMREGTSDKKSQSLSSIAGVRFDEKFAAADVTKARSRFSAERDQLCRP